MLHYKIYTGPDNECCQNKIDVRIKVAGGKGRSETNLKL